MSVSSTLKIYTALLCLVSTNVSAQSLFDFLLARSAGTERSVFVSFPYSTGNLYTGMYSPATGRTKIIVDLQLEDIYRATHSDGLETSIQGTHKSIDLQIPFSSDHHRHSVGLRMFSSRLSAQGTFAELSLQNLESRHDGINLQYTTNLGNSVDIGLGVGSIGSGTQSIQEYESTVQYHFSDRSTFSLKIDRRAILDFAQITVSKIDGLLPLDLLEHGGEAAIAFPIGNVDLQINARQGVIYSIPFVRETQNLQFQPSGTIHTLSGAVTFPIDQDLLAKIYVGTLKIDASGQFLSGNSPYGKVNSFIFRDRTYSIGFREQFSNAIVGNLDLQWREISGTLSGHLESWPFVSIFESPIVQRGDMFFDGALHIWKVHTEGNFLLGDVLGARIAVDLMRAIPRMTLETWGYRFLIFGVNNYQRTNFDLEWVDATLLSLNVEANFSPLQVTYAASQLVPLRIKQSETHSEGSGAPETGEPPSSSSGNSRGGLFQRIILAYQF